MARKKVVLVIVEGPSDDTALGIMLNQIYDKDSVHVHIMHGDITTRKGVRSDNIVAKIGDEVRAYAKSQHYSSKDFKQIIHIVDTDGAYIPDEKIISAPEADSISYESDGQVPFKASAAIPRIYRMKFQRDIYKDLRALEKSVGDNSEENSNLDMFSLEMFENIAFVMAKHADAGIPNIPEEWLDGFNTFSIYQVLPQLIDLWGLNVQTAVEAKKNFARQSVK